MSASRQRTSLLALALCVAAAAVFSRRLCGRPAPVDAREPSQESATTRRGPPAPAAVAAPRATPPVTPGRALDPPAPQEELMRRRAGDDPVARAIPVLAGVPPEGQLEYIQWVRTLPEGGYVANMPEILGRQDLTQAEMARLGRERLDQLADYLRSRGVRVPELPEGFTAVRLAEPPAAPPAVPEEAPGPEASSR